ncbi:hypothetical protein WMY93_011527 [Mugilogobius chulae]|uniref:Uncharacterized protein n=1 Tax=Mugilogobius chulae TaxID=88201 RepID=A0AAW0PE17_9GOBI
MRDVIFEANNLHCQYLYTDLPNSSVWLIPTQPHWKVVSEVVPEVFTGLWQPSPSSTQFSMPSSELAVLHKVLKGLSSAEVEVTFTRSIRHQIVNNILRQVWDVFPERELQTRNHRQKLSLTQSPLQTSGSEDQTVLVLESSSGSEDQTVLVLSPPQGLRTRLFYSWSPPQGLRTRLF